MRRLAFSHGLYLVSFGLLLRLFPSFALGLFTKVTPSNVPHDSLNLIFQWWGHSSIFFGMVALATSLFGNPQLLRYTSYLDVIGFVMEGVLNMQLWWNANTLGLRMLPLYAKVLFISLSSANEIL